MTERLLEAIERDSLLDTPFLRRVREKERVAALVEGEAKGEARGEAKGFAEAILDALVIRLNLAMPTYRRLERQALKLTDPERLRELHQAAIRANDVAEFEQALAGS
jgi:hypothetical protein